MEKYTVYNIRGTSDRQYLKFTAQKVLSTLLLILTLLAYI